MTSNRQFRIFEDLKDKEVATFETIELKEYPTPDEVLESILTNHRFLHNPSLFEKIRAIELSYQLEDESGLAEWLDDIHDNPTVGPEVVIKSLIRDTRKSDSRLDDLLKGKYSMQEKFEEIKDDFNDQYSTTGLYPKIRPRTTPMLLFKKNLEQFEKDMHEYGYNDGLHFNMTDFLENKDPRSDIIRKSVWKLPYQLVRKIIHTDHPETTFEYMSKNKDEQIDTNLSLLKQKAQAVDELIAEYKDD